MALYVAPDKPWELKLRSRQSFKAELEDVGRLWRLHARLRGDDEKQIDLAYVIRRSLENAVEAAFSDYGHRPRNEAEWKAVEQAIAQGVAAAAEADSKKKSSKK